MFGVKKRVKKTRRSLVKKRVKKTTRKPVKKSKPKRTTKKSALSGAIKDLNTEIRNLSRKKFELKRSLGTASTSLDMDRQQEQRLQNQIARLIEREAGLNKKKKNLQAKIDKISDKMIKISKIRSEMGDI